MPRAIRPIRIEGDVAYVPLTKGYEAVIDAADVPLVEGFNWTANVVPHTVYAYRNERSKTDGKRHMMKLHRCILTPDKGMEVDHIDGDGLNCRRSNMRLATKSQNMHNRKKNKNNLSGLKGVSWMAVRNKWRAAIRVNGRGIHLGLYLTAEEAHRAYAEASARFHGEFGRAA